MQIREKHVIYTGKVTPMVLLNPLFLAVASFIFVTLDSILFYLSIVFGTFLVIQLTKQIIRVSTFKIFITDKSILILSGVIKRKSLEYLLPHISGVSYYQGFLGRLLGYGSITLVVSGVNQTAITQIDAPKQLCDAVKKAIDNNDSDILYFNQKQAS